MTLPAAAADAAPTRSPRVRLLGLAYSSTAFKIRDFLSRSVVTYDWAKSVQQRLLSVMPATLPSSGLPAI